MNLIQTLDTPGITTPANSARAAQPNEKALRQAAAQFEALLLTQLTAALNPKEEEEGALFSNNGGGMGLARQMYSEQLAKTMSESGGIGIAKMIIDQATKRTAKPLKINTNHVTERALSAAREIKNEAVSSSEAKATSGLNRAGDLSHDARIISKASRSAEAAGAAGSTLPVSDASTLKFNDSSAAIGATRPRRVHAIEGNAGVLNEKSAVMAPLLPASSPLKSSRSVEYVSYQSPLAGEVRSRFGMRRDPINGRMRLHQGIDIPARRGTPIEAAAAGTVVFAGRNKGYGNMVMIEHADGRRTLYAHAQSLFVNVGDTVAAGQSIATVGSTGHSTGPHLHFEVRESNRSVNPLKALSNDNLLARR